MTLWLKRIDALAVWFVLLPACLPAVAVWIGLRYRENPLPVCRGLFRLWGAIVAFGLRGSGRAARKYGKARRRRQA